LGFHPESEDLSRRRPYQYTQPGVPINKGDSLNHSSRKRGSEERQSLRLPGRLGRLSLSRPGSAETLLDLLDPADPESESLIPYWADAWPSAEGLLRFLASPKGPRMRGRGLEIGAGLGILGMGALRMGWNLELSDFHPDSLYWLRLNLAANGFEVKRALGLDWREPPPKRWPVILASDILYEAPFAADLAKFLGAVLEPGGKAWIAEPGRSVAEAGIELLSRRFTLRIHRSRSRAEGSWKPIRVIELRAP